MVTKASSDLLVFLVWQERMEPMVLLGRLVLPVPLVPPGRTADLGCSSLLHQTR
jgi:hypothetical protein